MTRPTALVTGGAGFIGSHCCLDLLQNGYSVVVVDNLVNSSAESLHRVERLAGESVVLHEIDVTDERALDAVFAAHDIDVVVHFAAYKAVGDSMQRPLEYYTNNVGGLLSLLNAMTTAGVNRLVFSSSCSIYGSTAEQPLTESSPAAPVNPYATSKWMCEQILDDLCRRRPDWSVTALRYFNPVGAHESGDLGEDPAGIPTNIVPMMAQLAAGRHDHLTVFGTDYPTADGTAVRDYIHVMDVVEGHRLALDRLHDRTGFRRYNLGTGVGTSVLELVDAFREASGRPIPYVVADRRPGDVPSLVASADLAARELGWRPRRDLRQMVTDAWRFQSRNPQGYPAPAPQTRSA